MVPWRVDSTGMTTPPHPPLSPSPLPFETPVDTTRFVELDETEAELVRSDDVKVNLALRGKVGPDPYPFTFSSGTFSLGSFFRSYRPCRYIGIGIHRDHPAVYEHVLAASRLVAAVNDTMALAATLTPRTATEACKTKLRTLTTRTLQHMLELRRLTDRADPALAAAVGEFPLTIKSNYFKFLLFGLWNELWATAFQTAGADEVVYGHSALMTAAAAVHYYTRARESEGDRLDCAATAEARLRTVAIGWITHRAAEAQRLRQTGTLEIPWTREPANAALTGFKYTALCLASLAPFLGKKPPTPPSPRYEPAFRAATLHTTNAYGMTGKPASVVVEAVANLKAMAAAWEETGVAGRLGAVAHPGCTAAEIWAAPEVPARIAHLAAPA